MSISKKDTADIDRNLYGGISLLEWLIPLAQQINCLDIERIANVCIKNIPEFIGTRFASLYLLDENNSILHLQKYNHPFVLNKIVSLNQNPPSPMVLAVRSKGLIMSDNIDDHKTPVIKKSQRAFSRNYKTKSCIIVPLLCQDRVVGVLNLADKMDGGPFDTASIALIKLFSQLIGASIGNIKLFEKLQRIATTDGLTGLADHKTFYEVLEKELWRSRRYSGPISLIMVDVDNLKKVNDTYGHRAGDKVILEVSKKIKESIRQIDTAARYGGDEFAIILPNTFLKDAIAVAQRTLLTISNTYLPWGTEQIKLSVSVGVGQYDSDCAPEDMTRHSDQAMYSAKQSGGNRVRIFESLKN
jgi:diguanylate cyclase (GGDEF)-like protein